MQPNDLDQLPCVPRDFSQVGLKLSALPAPVAQPRCAITDGVRTLKGARA